VNPDGSFTYVPQVDDYGVYTFTFQTTDAGSLVSAPATATLHVTGGEDVRPQIVVAAPRETQLGVQQATIVLDPASKSAGATPLQYSLVGVPAGVTASIALLTNTAGSQTALLTWQLTGTPAQGDHFSFGILVIDADRPAATYQPVMIQLVAPLGPG
jgi:hypothetical protein